MDGGKYMGLVLFLYRINNYHCVTSLGWWKSQPNLTSNVPRVQSPCISSKLYSSAISVMYKQTLLSSTASPYFDYDEAALQ